MDFNVYKASYLMMKSFLKQNPNNNPDLKSQRADSGLLIELLVSSH